MKQNKADNPRRFKDSFSVLRKPFAGEGGFALVFSLVMLVVVTLLGVWALNTATIDTMIAGNEQRYGEDFNIGDGGLKGEAGKVGQVRRNWYIVDVLNVAGQLLVPPIGTASYDPGQDIPDADEPADLAGVDPADEGTWPRENLTGDYNVGNTALDYSYLVTYLYPDAPPPRYDATQMSAYHFRLNSERILDIEAGGVKVGTR